MFPTVQLLITRSNKKKIMKGYRKSHSKDQGYCGNIKCICEEFISLDDDDNDDEKFNPHKD